ncbi:hypothetical protein ACRAWG_39295 (plasmid) [Methylobacterium sp. P31]
MKMPKKSGMLDVKSNLLGLLLIFTSACSVNAANEPSDKERMDAYNVCSDAYQKKINNLGLGFIWGAVTGDLISAGFSWAAAIITENPQCDSVLTEAQRAELRREAQREQRRDRMDRMPR